MNNSVWAQESFNMNHKMRPLHPFCLNIMVHLDCIYEGNGIKWVIKLKIPPSAICRFAFSLPTLVIRLFMRHYCGKFCTWTCLEWIWHVFGLFSRTLSDTRWPNPYLSVLHLARHHAPHGRLLCRSHRLCEGTGSAGSRHQPPEGGRSGLRLNMNDPGDRDSKFLQWWIGKEDKSTHCFFPYMALKPRLQTLLCPK